MSALIDAEALVGLGAHLVDAAEGVEVVDVGGAEIDLQRLEDVGDRHVQHARLGAVDLQIDLRRVGREGREHAGELRILRRACPSSRRPPPARGRMSAPVRSCSWILKPPALPMPAHRRRRDRDDEGLLDRLQPPEELADDARSPDWPLRQPLVERLEPGEDRGRIGARW